MEFRTMTILGSMFKEALQLRRLLLTRRLTHLQPERIVMSLSTLTLAVKIEPQEIKTSMKQLPSFSPPHYAK
jgi:hypothetical protein